MATGVPASGCAAACAADAGCLGFTLFSGVCFVTKLPCCDVLVPSELGTSYARNSECTKEGTPAPTGTPTAAPTAAPTVDPRNLFSVSETGLACPSLQFYMAAASVDNCLKDCVASPSCFGVTHWLSACWFASAPCCSPFSLNGALAYSLESACSTGGTDQPTTSPTAAPTASPTGTPVRPTLTMDTEDGVGVTITGAWSIGRCSSCAPGYQGDHFLHDQRSGKGVKSVRFEPPVPEALAGRYEVLLAYTVSGTRATAVPVTVTYAHGASETTVSINQQALPASSEAGFHLLGIFEDVTAVTIGTAGTDGFKVIADAVRFKPAET